MNAIIEYKFPNSDKVISLPYDNVHALRYHLQNLMNEIVDKHTAEKKPVSIALTIREQS